MSWQVGQRVVADASAATVRGTRIAGGCQLHIDVAFRVTEWSWENDGSVSLVPQPSEVTARFSRGELTLGYALPNPTSVLSPVSHSSTANISFTLSLTSAALVELEAARDGGAIALDTRLVAHPFGLVPYEQYEPGIRVLPTVEQRVFDVPKEQWLAVLKSVEYCDSLLTELRLKAGGPESTTVGRQRVVNAVHARNDGRYRNSVQECCRAPHRVVIHRRAHAGLGHRWIA